MLCYSLYFGSDSELADEEPARETNRTTHSHSEGEQPASISNRKLPYDQLAPRPPISYYTDTLCCYLCACVVLCVYNDCLYICVHVIRGLLLICSKFK